MNEKERAKLHEKPVTGGSYDYVKYCADSSVYDVHHIISVEAINHKFTKSYGRQNISKKYRNNQIKLIRQGRIREVILEEINTIRSLFGSKYDKELEEMLKYVKKLEDNKRITIGRF